MNVVIKELEDNVRDMADESSNDLEKNDLLSTAARLSAASQGINVNPDMKNRTIYKKPDTHQVSFVGTLPSNKSFSYRTVDITKLFGFMDDLRNDWYNTKAAGNGSILRGIGNQFRGLISGAKNRGQGYNQQDLIENNLIDYYKRTGSPYLSNYFYENGLPNNEFLTEQQENALKNVRNYLSQSNTNFVGDKHRNQLIDTGNYRNISDLDLNQLRKGLSYKNSADMTENVNDYNNLNLYNRQVFNGSTADAYNDMLGDRNRALADQVNTYQNSSNQYQNAANAKTQLGTMINYYNKFNKKSAFRDDGYVGKFNADRDAIVDEYKLKQLYNGKVPKDVDDAIKEYKNSFNGDYDPLATAGYLKVLKDKLGPNADQIVATKSAMLARGADAQSQLKGQQALMNEANAELRRQGLTGIGDNKDYRAMTGNKKLVYNPKTGTSKYVTDKTAGPAVDRFTNLRNTLTERFNEYKKQKSDLEAQIARGTDNNGKALTEADKANLKQKIAGFDKTIASTKALYERTGGTDAQAQAAAKRAYENRSTADRRANEVTDVNQFNAITGANVQDLGQTAQTDLSNAQNAYNEAMAKDKNAYIESQRQKALESQKKAFEQTQRKQWNTEQYNKQLEAYKKAHTADDPTGSKFKFERSKAAKFDPKTAPKFDESKFNFDETAAGAKYNESTFQKGQGRDVYNTLTQAQQAVRENTGPKQLVDDGSGNYVYGTQSQRKRYEKSQNDIAGQAIDRHNQQRQQQQTQDEDFNGPIGTINKNKFTSR